MKLIHLSDLHLGKRVNEYPMIEDQEYILTKIINIIDDEKPDGVIIAGDVYDRSQPSKDAVELLDDFLVRLAKRRLQVFVISGNHDSPEHLAFASRLIDASGVHISPVYDGEVKAFELEDEYGSVCIRLLPFIKPFNVRRFFPDETVETFTDALRVAIKAMNVDTGKRNILVTHQFVTGAERSESEEVSVGGSDNVDASVFQDFDYVALGHIHGPQNIGNEKIRYCGTPLKYSFSEAGHKKSVTVVELAEKGRLTVRTVPLIPRRDMVELRGSFSELMLKSFYEGTTYPGDYTRITLTDELEITDAVLKLRTVYRNLMKLDYDNSRTRTKQEVRGAVDVENKSQLELFSELYRIQYAAELSPEQREFMTDLIEKVWGDEQ